MNYDTWKPGERRIVLFEDIAPTDYQVHSEIYKRDYTGRGKYNIYKRNKLYLQINTDIIKTTEGITVTLTVTKI